MTIESFVKAMPKVEVNLRLEGTIQKEALILIAEQNDVPLNVKPNKALVKRLEQVDFAQVDEFLRGVSKWIQQPEDFTRIVYEVGVSLAKQNVRYAEIGVAPSLYIENGLTFEQILTALNDGRARVERAWNVQLRWVLNVFRDEPRKFDDIVRWASSAAATKGGVVGIGLVGREVHNWVEEFVRPLHTAQRKELSRSVEIFESASTVLETLQQMEPERLNVGANVAEEDAVMQYASDKKATLNVCMARSLASGKIASYSDFPLRRLYDDGAVISLGSGMPSLYHTTLNQEYLVATEAIGLSIDELEAIALNAIGASFLADEVKVAMKAEFKAAYAKLRIEHDVLADAAG
jgi:adenosine deaminase